MNKALDKTFAKRKKAVWKKTSPPFGDIETGSILPEKGAESGKDNNSTTQGSGDSLESGEGDTESGKDNNSTTQGSGDSLELGEGDNLTDNSKGAPVPTNRNRKGKNSTD